jgi:spore maturation protein CgeB
MKALFIGQCGYGSTSLMRFNEIEKICEEKIELINIAPLINSTNRIFRSIGWRFKIGPLINNINRTIRQFLFDNNSNFDFVWIEKGVFIKPVVLELIKSRTKLLIHYTPDPAFLYHNSRYFNKCVSLYDVCVTTKTFEIDFYKKRGCGHVLYCTQGFDENIHRIYNDFESKVYDVCFIGHFEENRSVIIQSILDNNLSVVLAGINWENFVKLNSLNPNLSYFGKNVIGSDYAKLISQSRIGLGLLSKWIPEMHTTRTFEIPACGTALLTEKNCEIAQFFNDDEVIYVRSESDIVDRITEFCNDRKRLKELSMRGYEKVTNGVYTHGSIVAELLTNIFSGSNL